MAKSTKVIKSYTKHTPWPTVPLNSGNTKKGNAGHPNFTNGNSLQGSQSYTPTMSNTMPQGLNFTQNANTSSMKGIAKGSPMKGSTTTLSKAANKRSNAGKTTNSRRISSGKSLNNPIVKASGKGSSIPSMSISKNGAIRGTTRLRSGASSSTIKTVKGDKGKSIPLSSKKNDQVIMNRLSKRNAVGGFGEKSGLGSGGRRNRYKQTNRPTDKRV